MFTSEAAADPIQTVRAWMSEAESSEANDPTAASLGTVGEDGMPAVRMILVKAVDAKGFVFFTDFESRKGRHLLARGCHC